MISSLFPILLRSHPNSATSLFPSPPLASLFPFSTQNSHVASLFSSPPPARSSFSTACLAQNPHAASLFPSPPPASLFPSPPHASLFPSPLRTPTRHASSEPHTAKAASLLRNLLTRISKPYLWPCLHPTTKCHLKEDLLKSLHNEHKRSDVGE